MQFYKTENLTYLYPDSDKPALYGINLEISRGEVILIAGHSGCGKSTLLKLLAGLVPAFYGGKISGNAFYRGVNILDRLKPLAPQVGMLFQDPEKQLVTSVVQSEITLPMENAGVNLIEANKRLAETLYITGIEDLVDKKICNLSSGQKQKVALASILGMNPDVLLLDEPTSQIDPETAEELLITVRNLAEKNGKTVLISEHKLEKCLSFANRVIVMDTGRIIFDGKSEEYYDWAKNSGYKNLPEKTRLLSGLKTKGDGLSMQQPSQNPRIKIENLYFSYNEYKDVLKNINLEIKKGEFATVLGRNGSGKTTLLKNINGLLIPEKGLIQIDGNSTKGKSIYELAQKISYLGQNPDDYLFNDTVKDEILFTLKNFKRKWDAKTQNLIELFNLKQVENKNPRDLSTGQRQRTALASIMCMFQDVLLLDEPTRGMDYTNKKALGELLQILKNEGTTIVLVTHDTDFAAEYSDRVILMNEGEIIKDGYDTANHNNYSFGAVCI
ncbi:MAG: ABC transporter ATP-binding protein [Ignavibacteriales bacterium]